jgi:superfamily II RNA helicase
MKTSVLLFNTIIFYKKKNSGSHQAKQTLLMNLNEIVNKHIEKPQNVQVICKKSSFFEKLEMIQNTLTDPKSKYILHRA